MDNHPSKSTPQPYFEAVSIEIGVHSNLRENISGQSKAMIPLKQAVCISFVTIQRVPPDKTTKSAIKQDYY
jgi:hypothetical protein